MSQRAEPALDVEVFKPRGTELLNREEQPRLADADRRRRSRLRPLRRAGHGALIRRRADALEDAAAYESQHGNGGSPELAGDLLIVNCDGFDEAFVVALDTRTGKTRWRTDRARAAFAGLLDAARHPRRRTRPGRQRRRVQRRRLRSAERQGDLARAAIADGLQQRATPGLWRRPGVHCDRLQPAVAAGRAARRQGRRDQDTRRLDAVARRAAHAVAAPGRATSSTSCPTTASRPASRRAPARSAGSSVSATAFSASPVYADGRIYFLDEDGRTSVLKPGRAARGASPPTRSTAARWRRWRSRRNRSSSAPRRTCTA